MASSGLVERLRFGADDPARVVAAMTRIASARDGWVNLLPILAGDDPEADEDRPTSLRFWTLLSGGGPGLTMGTWVPAAPGQRGRERPSLGLSHRAGRRALGELGARAVVVPEGWVVEQDHPRRGLVLRPSADVPHEAVLAFALRALASLAPAQIRAWRADVHPPAAV